MGLDAKFRLVASRLRAEALGFCLLHSDKEYPIMKVECHYDDVYVYVPLAQGKLRTGCLSPIPKW